MLGGGREKKSEKKEQAPNRLCKYVYSSRCYRPQSQQKHENRRNENNVQPKYCQPKWKSCANRNKQKRMLKKCCVYFVFVILKSIWYPLNADGLSSRRHIYWIAEWKKKKSEHFTILHQWLVVAQVFLINFGCLVIVLLMCYCVSLLLWILSALPFPC